MHTTGPFAIYRETRKITPELFLEMCKAHDLTYTYSDDSRAYNNGKLELTLIELAAKDLGQAQATEIWNRVVDVKINDPYRSVFYWRTKDETTK